MSSSTADAAGAVEPGPAVGDALSDVEPGLELRLGDRDVDPSMAANADDRLATNPALSQVLAEPGGRHADELGEARFGNDVIHIAQLKAS